MSRRQISDQKYQDWLDRDRREGVPDTPERRRFLLRAALAAPEASGEPTYPCECCGLPRTVAEGGKTFTVCDRCWTARCTRGAKCKAPEASAVDNDHDDCEDQGFVPLPAPIAEREELANRLEVNANHLLRPQVVAVLGDTGDAVADLRAAAAALLAAPSRPALDRERLAEDVIDAAQLLVDSEMGTHEWRGAYGQLEFRLARLAGKGDRG